MSSNQQTESEIHRPARWRSPAGWSLRTRIVAIMVVLLTVLGVAVGGTVEIFLRKSLYDQLDTKVADAEGRSRGSFSSASDSDGAPHSGAPNSPGGGPAGGGPGGGPPGGLGFGIQPMSIMVRFTATDHTYIAGGIVNESGYNQNFGDLSPGVLAKLAALPSSDRAFNMDLGTYGDYRILARTEKAIRPGTEDRFAVTGLLLAETQSTLIAVALVTGSAVLIALVIAGWAGAIIVRVTLRPLRRVAATATRVSELKLDRGEVELAQRVPDRDTDPRTEVGQVGNALNQLLDHVRNALEARHSSEMQVRQFVADASHELRTPLAAIRGYAELSRRSRAPISEEIAHVLGRVESEAKRMTVLVEDLLLLARLDAGRPLAHDPVDLTMLVVDAVSDAHAAGPQHYWQLDVPNEPVVVIGDQQRLHQVLANLLANARTHTPEGTAVMVRVGATEDAAILQVIDSGPGIPAGLQSHIFERFARGDSSRSRAAGSTGLGLSIVYAVVTAHRGTVSVQSVPGQTVFTVALPLVPPGLMPTAGHPTVSAAGQFAQLAPRGR
jgi:two-component system OmpR family sensor kinase